MVKTIINYCEQFEESKGNHYISLDENNVDMDLLLNIINNSDKDTIDLLLENINPNLIDLENTIISNNLTNDQKDFVKSRIVPKTKNTNSRI